MIRLNRLRWMMHMADSPLWHGKRQITCFPWLQKHGLAEWVTEHGPLQQHCYWPHRLQGCILTPKGVEALRNAIAEHERHGSFSKQT